MGSTNATYVGSDFTITEGAANNVASYVHSLGTDFANSFDPTTNLPAANPNGEWSYLGTDDTTGSLQATDGLNPIDNFGAGAGWSQAGGVPSYARWGPFTTGSEGGAMVGHGPQKVVWTAPAEIDTGGVELTGFLKQIFEVERQLRLSVYKNDVAATGSPIVSVDAPDGVKNPDANFNADLAVDGADFMTWQRGYTVGTTQPEGDADFDGDVDNIDLIRWRQQYGGPVGATDLNTPANLPLTQVAIQPGDTLTFVVDATGEPGFNPAATFSSWDVIIREIVFPLGASAAVPEPSTGLLLLLGGVAGLGLRRRS